MKKYVTYILLIMFLLSFNFNVQASNYDINININNGKNSVNALEDYHVSVTYNGVNKLSSLSFDVKLKNTSCTITTPECNGLHCTLNNVSPNTRIVSMTCNNSGSSPIASISFSGIKALNTNGQNVNVSSYYKSISTKTEPTTTTTTKVTTQATVTTKTTKRITSRLSRTKRTTKKTTTTTTSKRIEEPITANLEVMSTEKINNLRLKKMSIVNYDIDFKANKKEYSITVPSNLEYLEIVALPISSDISLNNVGKVDIVNKDRIFIELSKDNYKDNYIINIKRKDKKKTNVFIIFIIMGIIVVGAISGILIVNWRNKKHEDTEELKQKTKENEDAKKLLEEELEITQTFYNLNKRL